MAERQTARSSSRRNTPQSPPKTAPPHTTARSPQVQIRRNTRSHSRDLDGSEVDLPRPRRGVRGKSAELPDIHASNKAGSTRSTQLGRGLSTVPEDSDNGDQDGGKHELNAGDANVSTHQTSFSKSKSPGALSVISGTTAQTSHSALELQDLSKYEMLAHLPELSNASDGILSFLAPRSVSESRYEDLVKELQDARSLASTILDRLARNFWDQKEVYGSDSYINTSIALRSLLTVRSLSDVGEGPWRPDEFFYKANLAILVKDLYSARFMSRSINTPLDKLERDFPAPFLSHIVKTRIREAQLPGESNMLKATFELALDLRTQYFLALANHHSRAENFDPDLLLRKLFYSNSKSLKGWDVEGMRMTDLSKQHCDLIIQRMKSIKQCFRELRTDIPDVAGEQVVNFEQLEDRFSWISFVAGLVSWARLRDDEIKAHIDTHNGIYGIQKALEVKVKEGVARSEQSGRGESPVIQLDYPTLSDLLDHGRSDQPEIIVPDQSHVQSTGIQNSLKASSFDSPFSIQHVKKKIRGSKSKAQKLTTSSANNGIIRPFPSTAPPSYQTRQQVASGKDITPKVPGAAPVSLLANRALNADVDDGWQPPIEDDGTDLISKTGNTTAQEQRLIVEAYSQNLLEGDKENHFDSAVTPAVPHKSRTFIDPQPNAQKISFDTQSSSQQHNPSSLRAKRRRDEERSSSPSEDEGFQNDNRQEIIRRKPISSISATRPNGKRPRVTEAALTTARASSSHDALEAEADEPAMTPLETIQASNDGARNRMRAMLSTRRPQKRYPWTAEETEVLLDLITEHGISWSYLKKLDRDGNNVLERRDQVALKDKARNMKMDMLINGQTLLENFDLVPLRASDTTKLRRMGVELDEDSGEA